MKKMKDEVGSSDVFDAVFVKHGLPTIDQLKAHLNSPLLPTEIRKMEKSAEFLKSDRMIPEFKDEIFTIDVGKFGKEVAVSVSEGIDGSFDVKVNIRAVTSMVSKYRGLL